MVMYSNKASNTRSTYHLYHNENQIVQRIHYTHIQLTLIIITLADSLQKFVGNQWHQLMQQNQALHVKNYHSEL